VQDLYGGEPYQDLVGSGSLWSPGATSGGAMASGYGVTVNPDGSLSYGDDFNGPYFQGAQLPSSFDQYSAGSGAASGSKMPYPSGDWTSEWTSGSVPANVTAKPKGSWFDDLMIGMGLRGKDGTTDLKDKRQVDSWMKMLTGGANVLNALLGGNKPRGYMSAAELQKQLASKYTAWTPDQRSTFDKYFYNATANRPRMSAADMTSPIRPGVGYAEGGGVDLAALLGGGGGAPQPEAPLESMGALSALGLVEGPGGGQDDMVPANLSPGEYVWDADTVSALGDGDNKQGAAILDATREAIRKHKRSAGPDQIPPRAKSPLEYMPQGAI